MTRTTGPAADAPDVAAGRPSPLAVITVLATLAGLAAVAVIAADAAAGDILVLRDAGAIARRGAPISAMIADLAGAVALGGAVLAGWMLRRSEDRTRAMGLVTVAAAVTTVSRGASLAFSYAVATGQPVGSERFGSDLSVFFGTDLGIWLVTALVVAAAATTVAITGSSVGLARTVAALIGVVAFCAAMTGHAAGDDTHEIGTSTMMVHLAAVGVWLGGLAVLQLLPPSSRDDAEVVRGYSHLALICWTALALSGVWALWVRMNTVSEVLTSPYVQLGLAKAVLLMALAVIGSLQRRQIAAGLAADGHGGQAARTYRQLAILELALMGLAVALAAAMSSSPPPAEVTVPESSPAAILSGYSLPSAPELTTPLTTWRPAVFPMALACVLVLAWWRPRAPRRTRAANLRLVLAAAMLVLLTSGALNVYGKVLISAHVLQHVLLMVVVGGLLGSVGAVPQRWRRWLRTRWWVALIVAALPVLVLAAAYAGPLLRPALDGHAAHLGLQLLALGGGVVTVRAIRCTDRPLAVAAAPLALLAAAGVLLLVTDALMASSWFGATGRTWWADALADQRRAGAAVLVVTAGVAAIALPATRGGRAARSPVREEARPQRAPQT